MKNILGKLITVMALFVTANAFAQLTDGDTASLDQYADQAQGNYPAINSLGAPGASIGMLQSAWQDPMQNMGEGQSKPAYSKYYWTPDMVLPIRVREGMMTLVNFPEWELIENVYSGDSESFNVEISGPNSILLYPSPNGSVGVDSNIILFGRSGNKYVFYIRSEGYNTERLTNSIIDIEVVGDESASGGSPSSRSGVLAGSGRTSGGVGRSGKSVASTYTRRFLKEDWLKSLPVDPAEFRFDIEIYVPNPDDVVIAPERVWRDNIFTYIDLGEKALNMTQRPIVTLIVERVETPVGFRTKGPNNRLIIVEGIGDMVMRSGKRMVCLKLRRSDEEGLQYATYADTSNEWDIAPAIPGKTMGTSTGTSPYNSTNGGANGYGQSGSAGGYANGVTAGGNSGHNMSGNTGSMGGFGQMGTNMNPNMSNNGSVSGNMITLPNKTGGYMGGFSGNNFDYSKMQKIDTDSGSGLVNPYPNYKYGSVFNSQNKESLSIELGTDADVGNLETLWKDLSSRYSSLLGGYEPFYSVDAPADGQGKELFHLRVGPVKSLESGDSICSQLGRSGIFCSVVRVQ